MRVLVRRKLVVSLWELIHMESGAEKSDYQDTGTFTKYNEELEAIGKRYLWRKDENWPRLKNDI